MRHIWSCAFALALLVVPSASEAKTTVRYQPTSPTIGPFPTDVLTTVDPTQKTGRHVDLQSAPFCLGSQLVSCQAVKQLLNQFDGFSVKPQIRICFSGPIDITTVQDAVGIAPADGSPSSIGVNQIFYDRSTSCVLAKPDHVLNQSTTYLLFVSNRIRDAAGKPVERDPLFKACAKGGTSDYCDALSVALRQGPEEAQDINIVGGSLFTTMSATDWMEKARNFVYNNPVPPTILPAGPTSVFDVPALNSFVWLPQTNIGAPPSLSTAVPIPLQALQDVQKVAFGLYLSPNHRRARSRSLPRADQFSRQSQ
jgi:Bacterial Ig-like domain